LKIPWTYLLYIPFLEDSAKLVDPISFSLSACVVVVETVVVVVIEQSFLLGWYVRHSVTTRKT